MGSAEVYMAMQRGTIDGQSSGTSAMRDRKIHEVAKYLTVTNHASPEFILAMNDRSFAKMSKEQQDAFMEAAKEVQEETRKMRRPWMKRDWRTSRPKAWKST